MKKTNLPFQDNKINYSLQDLQFNEKDFETFFKENFTSLCAYCQIKFKFDLDLAKEMAHTAFIKFWETHDLSIPNLSLKGYLYKILTNNCIDYIRHKKVKDKYEDYFQKNLSSTSFENSSDIDMKQLTDSIDKSISELPQQMCEIFKLSRNEGLKYNQIAEHFGISVKTVETQISRALVKLRLKLTKFRNI